MFVHSRLVSLAMILAICVVVGGCEQEQLPTVAENSDSNAKRPPKPKRPRKRKKPSSRRGGPTAPRSTKRGGGPSILTPPTTVAPRAPNVTPGANPYLGVGFDGPQSVRSVAPVGRGIPGRPAKVVAIPPGPLTVEQAIEGIRSNGGRVIMEDGKAIKVFYNRTRIPDAALRPVKYLPTLKILNISDTAVTDAGLEYLKGLKELRRLYPHGSGLTDVGIEEIRVALPDLEVLQ